MILLFALDIFPIKFLYRRGTKMQIIQDVLPRPSIATTIYCHDHLLPRPSGRGLNCKEGVALAKIPFTKSNPLLIYLLHPIASGLKNNILHIRIINPNKNIFLNLNDEFYLFWLKPDLLFLYFTT